MDYQFVSTLAINLVGLGFMAWQVRIMKQQLLAMPSPRSAKRLSMERQLGRKLYIPVFVMAGLVLLSWLPYVVNAWKPAPLPNMLIAWGGTDTGCSVAADTSPIVKFKDKYRLFLACNIPDASVDIMQDQRIAVSKPFGITGGPVEIAIAYDRSSGIAQIAKPGTRTSVNLVLLPKDKDGTSIKRLADVADEGGAVLTPGTIPKL
jgi:hypothetical protein